ncbi:MAG TPA: LD-carboxypeptidase [Sediminibacterium sp.]|uniref:S66 peptidase family protein n=1 Tax=Sediminibacterium sp. TaxID=1917865 RepID=UPI0008C74772|nr:LD-carboxypeptidase [Sediminibacterium sp.]OHC86903.1 MAG: LD-carboxypeptidase [Sphingobacteriia bacterium RIFOXYC2_FULL_35_18]OHC88240.1 MAG: LD-carboxypeptidase [Sphingobacteriia bacterium RIFOXYD2_FULL_35_12]HLD51711.1 LD-carboxypeptidase [Sediminibacterium sp.]
MITLPPYLKKGDTIAITCPAGYMEAQKIKTGVKTLQEWGFQVMVGKTVGSKSTNYFSGTDEERRDEFQALLDEPSIKAILCGRGGYGITRIIDQLDFKTFKKNPKWIIGFSDITVLHAHVLMKCNTASLHAPMANAFNEGGAKLPYVQSLQKALKGTKAKYTCTTHAMNQLGKASGVLMGGNLALIAHLVGSKMMYKTKGSILFLEDVGEYAYNIDRMFIQLKRAGIFNQLSGLILGGFTDRKDTTRPFGKTVEEIIQEHIAEYDYPICFGFPVSHDTENYALKVGASFELSVTSKLVRLKELS